MHIPAFTAPPPRRLAGLALFQNEHGEVLLLEKKYRTGRERLGLVGGYAEPGESAPAACRRHIERETGLKIVPGTLLVAHHMPQDGEVKEGLNFVFFGGILRADIEMSLPADEFTGRIWADPDDLSDLVAPYTEWRINVALDAKDRGPVQYLVGHPESRTAA